MYPARATLQHVIKAWWKVGVKEGGKNTARSYQFSFPWMNTTTQTNTRGFVCKRFLSFPSPSPSFIISWLSFYFSRGQNRNSVPRSFLAPKLNRNACYAGYLRHSLLNNFYCDILHLFDIVIPKISSVTFVNLKKACMASRNIVMKKQYTLFWSALQ